MSRDLQEMKSRVKYGPALLAMNDIHSVRALWRKESFQSESVDAFLCFFFFFFFSDVSTSYKIHKIIYITYIYLFTYIYMILVKNNPSYLALFWSQLGFQVENKYLISIHNLHLG